ncbi:TIGR02186 family protein [Stappia taiwanensis]|uniref:TIGR02186 family protein n=2 Tax=Stappia taiwanensis TaxID=992267 RepID=A0A838XPK3_9HYPH|nr:TIGR02186 family protein [Stappia taiwanensis]
MRCVRSLLRRPAGEALAGALALALALTLLPASGKAEDLVVDLSDDTINIESNFTGANIVVFGQIVRDAATVGRPEPYDLAVIVSGPETRVTTRRKGRFAGIWVNRDAETFLEVPSFLVTHTSRRANEIAPRPVLEQHRIGLFNLNLPITGDSGVPMSDRDNFRRAFLRLRVESGLYAERSGVIEFLSDTLFRTTVPLPANVPVGEYTVTTYLLRGGALLASNEQSLVVAKTGFEQLTYRLAYNYAAVYGLLAIALAVFTGWLAGVIFRRD